MPPPTISSLSIPAWEYRQEGLGEGSQSARYVVYKIVVATETGQWMVFRRYSDFVTFDQTVKRILPAFDCHLPPRETLRPLAGLFGVGRWFGGEGPSVAFVEGRRRALDIYVKQLLRVTAGRAAVWNHPTMLSFFDLPSITLPSTHTYKSAAMDETPPVPLDQWPSKVQEVQIELAAAQETRRRIERFVNRVIEHTTDGSQQQYQHYLRHLQRQRTSTEKHLEQLRQALDFYAQVERVPDEKLELMTKEFQGLIYQLSKLSIEGEIKAPPEAAALNSSSSLPLGTPIISPSTKNAATIKSTPLARTPSGRKSLGMSASSLPSVGSATLPRMDSSPRNLETLNLQEKTLSHQDAQLSELSAVIQRHRTLGLAIHSELQDQNAMLEEMQNRVEEESGKMGTVTRRVKKL